MQTETSEKLYHLQQDGCYICKGIQHYLFPREVEKIEDLSELALTEFVWHQHPEWQGQVDDSTVVVEQNWEAIDAEIDRLIEQGKSYTLFPRETFVTYVGEDWDAIAYMEWRWYVLQGER
ncbi:MAG TPA: hypothetical protein DCE56_02450 [Cyanobacteria bacterium UBA8553]|nr:hypothetical protein [Cyanobacteria bacterium UBA8553]HAJ63938.1 hypothetical protein [Cyanobacteria bacterium UBA8543]